MNPQDKGKKPKCHRLRRGQYRRHSGICPECGFDRQLCDGKRHRQAHPDPDKWYKPYIIGNFVDQAFMTKYPGTPACKLGSGTDDDWGFGTCGNPVIWNANSGTEYITLARIPNPWVQPK